MKKTAGLVPKWHRLTTHHERQKEILKKIQ
jgi:hypothetical protein